MSRTSCILACFLAPTLGFPVSAKDSEKDPLAPKPPTFQVPKGWQAVEPGPFTSARLKIGDGDRIVEMTVTGLQGEGGGLAANIIRWRAIVGLEDLSEKDALKSAQSIKVSGIPGHAVDLTGPDVPGKPTLRILVAVVKQGEHTWYFKLTGPSSLVAEQKSAYDGFLKSIRFEK